MTNVLYSVSTMVDIVILFVMLMYNRRSHEEHARPFKLLLFFMIAFCAVDMLWGLIASGFICTSVAVFRFVSVLFHSGVVATAYVWCKYVLHYIGIRKSLFDEILLILPILVVAGLLTANRWTDCMFTIDPDMSYHSGALRPMAFVCEGVYFIVALAITVVTKFKTKDTFKRARFVTVEIFCSVPIIFLILQIMFPRAPFVSCGYLISSMAFYIGIISAEQTKLECEKALAEVYEDRNVIFSEMLKMQSGGVIATDGFEHIYAMNDAAAHMFGFSSAAEVPDDFNVLLERMEFDNYEEARENYDKFREDGEGITYFFRVKNYRGNLIYVMGVPRQVRLPNGSLSILTSYTDITKGKALEDEILRMSRTDALTGISNRGYGEECVEALLAEGATGTFCILDIDKFKKINDSHGHLVGDKALIEAAKALKNSFRDKDIVMRLGGDEFAVFALDVTTEADAGRCFERLFKNLEAISIPEMGDEGMTVSLGAVFVTETGRRTFDEIYQLADITMYRCKDKPGNVYEIG